MGPKFVYLQTDTVSGDTFPFKETNLHFTYATSTVDPARLYFFWLTDRLIDSKNFIVVPVVLRSNIYSSTVLKYDFALSIWVFLFCTTLHFRVKYFYFYFITFLWQILQQSMFYIQNKLQ